MPSFFSRFSRQPLLYVAIIAGGAALCLFIFVLYLLLASPAGQKSIKSPGNQPKEVKILSAEEKLQLINSLASSSVSSSTAAKKKTTALATTTLSAEEKKRIIESFNKQLETILPPAKKQKMLEYIRSKTAPAATQ